MRAATDGIPGIFGTGLRRNHSFCIIKRTPIQRCNALNKTNSICVFYVEQLV